MILKIYFESKELVSKHGVHMNKFEIFKLKEETSDIAASCTTSKKIATVYGVRNKDLMLTALEKMGVYEL